MEKSAALFDNAIIAGFPGKRNDKPGLKRLNQAYQVLSQGGMGGLNRQRKEKTEKILENLLTR
ncbi:hypothetical protein AALC17_15420 [Oscillospiraceae bacterium 38-13]